MHSVTLIHTTYNDEFCSSYQTMQFMIILKICLKVSQLHFRFVRELYLTFQHMSNTHAVTCNSFEMTLKIKKKNCSPVSIIFVFRGVFHQFRWGRRQIYISSQFFLRGGWGRGIWAAGRGPTIPTLSNRWYIHTRLVRFRLWRMVRLWIRIMLGSGQTLSFGRDLRTGWRWHVF